MVQKSFSADVDAWVRQTEKRMTGVFRESTQRVFADVLTPVGSGGNMPVDTGFLRASFQASLNAPVNTVTFNDGGTVWSPDAYALVIAGAEMGDTIYGVFTANYARAQEYGSQGRSGRGFVRLAAQKWPQIVAQVSREAQSRSRG